MFILFCGVFGFGFAPLWENWVLWRIVKSQGVQCRGVMGSGVMRRKLDVVLRS
jgi:hypothetical protein